MSPSRISRGFHWIGLLLAALPVFGTVVALRITAITAVEDRRRHDELTCAHNKVSTKDPFADIMAAVPSEGAGPDVVNLHKMGCSDDPEETVSDAEVWAAPPPFTWKDALVWPFARIIGAGLFGALMLYGAVRAVGWWLCRFVTQ